MADDWEDWEDDSYVPAIPSKPVANGAAPDKNAKAQPAAVEVDSSKFAGEDEEEEEEKWKKNVPQTEKKKEETKKKVYERGSVSIPDEPLDDPVAEKKRQQQLAEAADLRAAEELFGTGLALEKGAPKTAKEAEEFGRGLALKYLHPMAGSQHYKAALKALLKAGTQVSSVQDIKDLEACLAGVRSDKIKEENAAKLAKKGEGKKKTLNAGRGGGTAGLDDYVYSEETLDNDYDFM
ncbi:hypothetical protein WJX84_004020 [Apatococcus fuscideae]|uniref:Eukaryotic translation initiation factor 3 30 kDa subunit n=1 Tax=Apatococcus fuscideae TaxID=2026836 RepID=A0AAW1T5F6_9CHLO